MFRRGNGKVLGVIKEHVKNNQKEYTCVVILFFIGIVLGVIFSNNLKLDDKNEVINYINNFVDKMKTEENVNYEFLLKSSIKQKLILAISLWLLGTTVIGIPIVLGIVMYEGFCFGYTASIGICVFGVIKGLWFNFTTLFFQNLICVPIIFALAVSGIKMYKAIVKYRENIKQEIIRHTMFSVFMLVGLVSSTIIEVFILSNLIRLFLKI